MQNLLQKKERLTRARRRAISGLLVLSALLVALSVFSPSLVSALPVTPPVTPPTPPPVTPPSNTPPHIITNSLPTAKVGRKYRTFVLAYDNDINDSLTMTISELPEGLRFGRCKQRNSFDTSAVRCVIAGRPRAAGTYSVNIDVSDGTTNVTKTLFLTIKPRR